MKEQQLYPNCPYYLIPLKKKKKTPKVRQLWKTDLLKRKTGKTNFQLH